MVSANLSNGHFYLLSIPSYPSTFLSLDIPLSFLPLSRTHCHLYPKQASGRRRSGLGVWRKLLFHVGSCDVLFTVQKSLHGLKWWQGTTEGLEECVLPEISQAKITVDCRAALSPSLRTRPAENCLVVEASPLQQKHLGVEWQPGGPKLQASASNPAVQQRA